MQTYTSLRLSDVAADLNKLPNLPTNELQVGSMTGTDLMKTPFENEASVSVARLVARPDEKTGYLVTTHDDASDAKNSPDSVSAINEKTPDLQGFDHDCRPMRTADQQKPPKGLEPSTYALRKRRSAN